jgi:hypothetical protein
MYDHLTNREHTIDSGTPVFSYKWNEQDAVMSDHRTVRVAGLTKRSAIGDWSETPIGILCEAFNIKTTPSQKAALRYVVSRFVGWTASSDGVIDVDSLSLWQSGRAIGLSAFGAASSLYRDAPGRPLLTSRCLLFIGPGGAYKAYGKGAKAVHGPAALVVAFE